MNIHIGILNVPKHGNKHDLIHFITLIDTKMCSSSVSSEQMGSVRVAERLVLPTSDHGVASSNPAGGEILLEPKRRFLA